MYMKDIQNKVVHIFLLSTIAVINVNITVEEMSTRRKLIIYVRDIIQVRQYHGTMCQAMILDNVTGRSVM